jgi:outer membrane protein OmpA-like peptidoglycan-associated protein
MRQADWRITIEGHTDNVGTDAYNQDLSTRRAAAVKDALVRDFKVPAGRLTTAGFGESRPRETNDTIAGRARNRRVELVRDCDRSQPPTG